MFAFAALVTLASAALPRVFAHGGVLSYKIDGQIFQGWAVCIHCALSSGDAALVLISATALALRLPRWTDDHPASLVELVRFLSWLYCGSEDDAMFMLHAIPTFQQPHY